MTTKPRLSF
ncbi:hypothetical protein D030_2498A, partial [Vibrio parahaemolyticus AQ3810]